MADQNYWVRTEQGRVWGPFTLAALDRLRGQLTEKSEASLDGQTWRPGTEFPELREFLQPARKVERKAATPEAAPPRISKAMAEAFGLKEGSAAAPEPAAPAPEPAKRVTRRAAEAPPPPVEKPLEVPESGDLAQLSPVRLYALAALTSASGWLTLELDKGRMLQISFRRGTPEHLSSDDPELSLLRFLLQRGLVDPTSALAAEEQATASGQDIVSVLFQLQLIPPADAHRLLGDYASFLLDRALMTWRGKFTFEKDAPPPPGAFPLGSRWTLLAESVRRLDVPKLRARLGKRLLQPVVRSGGLGVAQVDELALNAQESRLYAGIDGTRTGDELLKAQDVGVAVRLLYLLTELGHLGFAALPDQETPDPEPQAAKVPPPTLGQTEAAPAPPLPGNAERAPEKKPQRELPKLAREAGREPGGRAEIPKLQRSAPPVMQPRTVPPAPVKPAPPPVQISRPPPAWAATPQDETPEDAVARISELLERFEKADHFEVLGMERKSATAAEAKRNFFVLAKELHPDTVADPEQVELRELKERLFSRINGAAQVLSDDKRRKEYEDELEGKKNNVDVARIFAAEENFQRAEIMIKARRYPEGLELLEKAIAMNDKEAEFFAWRGYARFLIAKDRKAAYEECAGDCKNAIKMVELCLPAHLFLGHMAKVVGDLKLAQKCYHRVLELDEHHVEAARELRLMGKKS